MTDSEDVFVARTHSSETTASTSAKTCCLTFISSKTASMHEVGVGEGVLARSSR